MAGSFFQVGRGLHKLEPRELANVDATSINTMLSHLEGIASIKQLTFKETFTDFSRDQLV